MHIKDRVLKSNLLKENTGKSPMLNQHCSVYGPNPKCNDFQKLSAMYIKIQNVCSVSRKVKVIY